ncbi:MAG: MATE family efflux transporter [Candidatus Margulisiibacteriota bacterium]|nr:MAG: MATE family efflux transporter [Candidatus Margulisbacteria bacterium GWD2_39_127]OGI01201.1 MAG: MATE family efflux transporter [Candidatus Margulisbacteria bacterium GWF2_38_17]OGI09836.1 MAG: MATE family efflux transporter [Candidatus Margulisbacteria bacterium GWE2_39_32]PZM78425.1 MAG: MATE family efflux transporter [Candidatus Margulisiibacteriota bacterium]HAR64163.1 MATE family efflux transporter [Candidatus Margulisiibacteriota bacterium]
MDHAKQLTELTISRLLFRFSFPAIIALLVSVFYNIVDRFFVGRAIGTMGIAATTVALPIMLILMAFIMLVGGGAATLITLKLGAKKKERAELVLGNSFTLFIAFSLILSVLGLVFLDPLLKIFGASQDVLPYARIYTGIILTGNIFQTIGLGMNSFIQGEGKPKLAMAAMLIGCLVNILLCPLFINVFNLGIGGSALATVIAQMVSAAFVLYYYLSGRSILKLYPRNLLLDRGIVFRIVAIGVAPFSMQIAASILNAILNNQLLTYGGDTAISVMGVIYSILALLLMPISGINQGMLPIIGHNYGAGKFCRVQKTLKLALVCATIIAIAGFILTRVYSIGLIHMFSKGNHYVVMMGRHAMLIFFLVFPVMGLQLITTNYFQAIGKAKHMMFLNLSRQLIILIPAIIILPRFWGLDGIWYVMPLADAASALLTGIWLVMEMQRLNVKKSEQARNEAALES